MSEPAPRPPVFLIGFMATGKSAVGRALAERLGADLLDLDDEIAREAGRPIPEIFDAEGEAGFRRREAEALAAAIDGGARVIATGGGAPTFGDNAERMRAAGLVVELTGATDTLLARAEAAGGAAARPLLAGDPAALLAARQPIYRRAAHATVSTDDRAPGEVAAQIAGLLDLAADLGDALPRSSVCALRRKPYPIAVGAGLFAELGAAARRRLPGARTVAVISDDNVAPLYLGAALDSLAAAGLRPCDVTIAAGEASKTPETHRRLAEQLVAAGLDRQSAIIALGGGVVGDLAGYVAATLFRGVRLVQVPTSLVAMVDSAIGGKTGVNLAAGKNLLGAFWQPELVLVDPELLATLPERERRAGLGEMFKYGLLDGADLWRLIEREPDGMEAISRAAGYKSWIVTRDEREETGERALLNLGHTVGHAIERAAGYGALLHGEAVALGLLAAARVSSAVGLAPPELEGDIAAALVAAGLDTELDPWLRPEVLDYVGVDKKRTGEAVKFVLLGGVGRPEVRPITLTDLRKILVPAERL